LQQTRADVDVISRQVEQNRLSDDLMLCLRLNEALFAQMDILRRLEAEEAMLLERIHAMEREEIDALEILVEVECRRPDFSREQA